MLVLSRKANETIHVGDAIVIKVHRIDGNRVKLGIEAPEQIRIIRGELLEDPDAPEEEGGSHAA